MKTVLFDKKCPIFNIFIIEYAGNASKIIIRYTQSLVIDITARIMDKGRWGNALRADKAAPLPILAKLRKTKNFFGQLLRYGKIFFLRYSVFFSHLKCKYQEDKKCRFFCRENKM